MIADKRKMIYNRAMLYFFHKSPAKRIIKQLLFCGVFLCLSSCIVNATELQIGRLRYSGGGDWYTGSTIIPNLYQALNKHLGLTTAKSEKIISLRNESAFEVPLLFATGHGNINFTEAEARNLRHYLLNGGFLWVDDNYGIDPYFRKNIKKVFPEKELQALSSAHLLYNCYFPLSGLPKIHEHDGEPAQGFAIFHENRMIVFYSYSSDIGNGLEDASVHGLNAETRLNAQKFAVNLIFYLFNHN